MLGTFSPATSMFVEEQIISVSLLKKFGKLAIIVSGEIVPCLFNVYNAKYKHRATVNIPDDNTTALERLSLFLRTSLSVNAKGSADNANIAVSGDGIIISDADNDKANEIMRMIGDEIVTSKELTAIPKIRNPNVNINSVLRQILTEIIELSINKTVIRMKTGVFPSFFVKIIF
jgi:hypothetical protein